LRRVTEVGPSDWAEIRDFGSRYFEGEFIASMQAKRDLVELRGADGPLLGIGAVDLFDVTHEGRTVTVIHGSSTAFLDETRGMGYVQRIAFRYFLRAKWSHPLRPVYAAFNTYSWRSYLSQTRTFRLCWPHRSFPPSAWEAGLYERVGKRLNGDRFDPRTGLAHNRDRRLRPDIAGVPAHLAGDPDVRYFVEHNPGYPSGDLLVCLVPLNFANWTAAASRIAKRLRRRRRRASARSVWSGHGQKVEVLDRE
jgi:hypothetical protein